VAFARQALSLKESGESICPIYLNKLSPTEAESPIRSRETAQRIAAAYETIARGKDIVVIEGPEKLEDSRRIGISPARLLEMLAARPILVTRLRLDKFVERISEAVAALTEQPLGVVINAIEPKRLYFVEKILRPALEQRGIPVLAAIPWDSLLAAPTVEDILKVLQGEILCAKDQTGEFVESVAIGTMGSWSHIDYFNRINNKAIITKINRPDIILASLETANIKCLIMTGRGSTDRNFMASIIARATRAKIPLIRVEEGTTEVVDKIQHLFNQAQFHNKAKLERAEALVAEHFDWSRFTQLVPVAQQALRS